MAKTENVLFDINTISIPSGLENRRYWSLRDILPASFKNYLNSTSYDYSTSSPMEKIRYTSNFKLQNKMWRISLYHDNSRGPLYLTITLHSMDADTAVDQFNVLIGIINKSAEEIAVSRANVRFSSFEVVDLIDGPIVDSIFKSNEDFWFFVEIYKKVLVKELKTEERTESKEKEKEKETKNSKRKFQTDYEELLLSGKHSDCILKVKHMKFQAHRLILAARSVVFSAMMEHEMQEKRNSEISINHADPDIFRKFLIYLYTGDGEQLDDWKTIVELYKLGHKYCVEDLKELCVERMKAILSMQNFFEIFMLSQQPNNAELSDVAIQFFLENSKEIIGSEKYFGLMKDHPDEAYVLIKAFVDNK